MGTADRHGNVRVTDGARKGSRRKTGQGARAASQGRYEERTMGHETARGGPSRRTSAPRARRLRGRPRYGLRAGRRAGHRLHPERGRTVGRRRRLGHQLRDGITLAVEEINAKGGILGKKLNVPHIDTQSDASIAPRAGPEGAGRQSLRDPRAGLLRLGAGHHDARPERRDPEIVGGEAAAITQKGNPFVFRTAFGQQFSMPKIANYIRDGLKAKNVAVLWVNNDFGKGGRDNFAKEMQARGIKVVADISTESGQVDFASDVVKLKAANADAVFVYTNEEESARFLKEARKQSLQAPLIGETTLLSQKVIELAGDAANGVKGHVGLSSDAPVPALAAFGEKFKKRFNYANDHNGIKGYIAVYMIKHVTEKMGKFDSKGSPTRCMG